jgi:hypothetical protein
MSDPEELPEHVARNRSYWDEIMAVRYVDLGRCSWASDRITWGIFDVPEADLGVLPTELSIRSGPADTRLSRSVLRA